MKRKYQNGQVMSEYAIMMAMFLGITLMLMMLLAVFTEYGWRLVSLVALPWP